MLTERERDRLINRSDDSRIRSNNDAKMRAKLSDWLADLEDAQLIFKLLPFEQIQKIVSDEDAYSLFELSMSVMSARNFNPIVGKIEDVDGWGVVIDKSNFNEDITKSAQDIDIVRSAHLTVLLGKLEYLLRSEKNPVAATTIFLLSMISGDAAFSLFLKNNPDILEKYKKSSERIRNAGFELPEAQSAEEIR